MNFYLFDSKKTKTGKWYLCKCNLYEYLTDLAPNFYDFQVQRRIVRNIYLDGLYNTIISGDPIPAFTITADKVSINGTSLEIDMKKANILDGLQRSFRLWAILEFHKIAEENSITTPREFIRYMKEEGGFGEMVLGLDFVSSSFLKKVFDKESYNSIINAYKEFDIQIVIWEGLSENDIMKKMLLLNAGQRPVSSTHQYELLFLHKINEIIPKLGETIKLYRERDGEYYKIKRGDRSVGEYQMSSIIIALQSLIEKKPLRIAPANMIEWDSDSFFEAEYVAKYFNTEFLCNFIYLIRKMDEVLSEKDPNYLQWFGKDTTLSGIFAGLGKYINSEDNLLNGINKAIDRINSGECDFCITEFERELSKLAGSRINVGNAVRKAIAAYTQELFTNGSSSWSNAFNLESKG